MNDAAEVSGRCLCDAVRLSVRPTSLVVDACHCAMCRRWSGGPLMTVEGSARVTFQGEEHITVYDSSEWAQRGFCRHCGTHEPPSEGAESRARSWTPDRSDPRRTVGTPQGSRREDGREIARLAAPAAAGS